jgi:hypothetical protein
MALLGSLAPQERCHESYAGSYHRLEMVWKGVEAEVRRFCGQNIAQPADAYVDFLPESDWHVPVDPLLQQGVGWHDRHSYVVSGGPSHDGHLLPLRQGLVRSITEIRIDTASSAGTDGSDFPSSTILSSDFYFLDVAEKDPSDLLISRSGIVVYKGGNWPTRRRSIKVTYVAGLTAAELDDEYSDIRLAVCQEVLERYQNLSNPGVGRVKSERLGDWAVTYATSDREGRLSHELREALHPFVLYRM